MDGFVLHTPCNTCNNGWIRAAHPLLHSCSITHPSVMGSKAVSHYSRRSAPADAAAGAADSGAASPVTWCSHCSTMPSEPYLKRRTPHARGELEVGRGQRSRDAAAPHPLLRGHHTETQRRRAGACRPGIRALGSSPRGLRPRLRLPARSLVHGAPRVSVRHPALTRARRTAAVRPGVSGSSRPGRRSAPPPGGRMGRAR